MTAPPATGVSAWLHAYRSHLRWFLAAVLVLAALAWLLPISNSVDTDSNADRPLGDAPRHQPPEDLTAFVDVKRWGISLRQVNERIAEEEAQGLGRLNPALRELGYVGLVVEADANTVLLTTTEGDVARLESGDALPDGRVLTKVGGNSITLRAASGGEVEVLEMFPRPSTGIEAEKEAQ